VLAKCAEPQLHHRTPTFRKTLESVTGKLQTIFRTKAPVYTVTGSGSSAFEAGLLAVLRPGANVLNVANGKFSERWSKMAKQYGGHVTDITKTYGDHVTPDDLATPLAATKFDLFIVTHSETSTGAVCDLPAVLAKLREHQPDCLIMVDGITSIGALPFDMDALGVDIAITGSQKAMMLPPGLGFVALSERAWVACDANDRADNFYLDLKAYRASYENWDTPYTPNNQLIHAADVSLGMIVDEGLETVWQRTEAHAEAVRAGVAALGLELFAQMPGNSVSSILYPAGVDNPDKTFRLAIRKRFNIHLAGGQGDMKPKLFRINHMGYTDIFEAVSVVSALEFGLADVGKDIAFGTGVAAAQKAAAAVLNR
ncbi:MAG: alanine--glyoxylate aminotransferase family protein, partial [Planctomycetota bacterium]